MTADPVGSSTDEPSGLEDSSSGVGEFLVALALAVHRYAMYPPNHPSLNSSLESVVREITRVLAERGPLAISVRDGCLLVDTLISDESHTLFADLARRMEEHQLGAVVFRQGVTVEEMDGILNALSRDPQRSDAALGLMPVQDRPSWEHALLQPVGYEFLQPGTFSDRPRRSVEELWGELQRFVDPGEENARTGLAIAERLRTLFEPTAEDPVATHGRSRTLERVPEATAALDSGEARKALNLVIRILDELGWSRGSETDVIRGELVELLLHLPPATIGRMVTDAERSEEDAERKGASISRRLLVVLSRADLSPGAVSRVCEGLSLAEDPAVSTALASILGRLADMATLQTGVDPTGVEAEAAAAVRTTLERSMTRGVTGGTGIAPGRWQEGSGDGQSGRRTQPIRLSTRDARRIVDLSLEVDEVGPALEHALRTLVRTGAVAEIIDAADAAPPNSRVARAIEEHLVTPDQLRIILSGEDVDDASLTAMVNRLGDRALDPLFDRLAGSESRAIRRKVFDCLTAMGERVSGTIMTYLEDPPWFVQRNMLALLQRMPTLPSGFSPLQHLGHEDARVRREALPLALRVAGAREDALKLALSDSDEGIVRMALLELQDEVPDTVVLTLIDAGLRSERFPQLRSLGARALGRSRRDDARVALLEVCVPEGSDEKPSDLAPRDPVVLAALVALAEGWPDDPEVMQVLELGTSSPDPRIRAAAAGEEAGRSDARGRSADPSERPSEGPA